MSVRHRPRCGVFLTALALSVILTGGPVRSVRAELLPSQPMHSPVESPPETSDMHSGSDSNSVALGAALLDLGMDGGCVGARLSDLTGQDAKFLAASLAQVRVAGGMDWQAIGIGMLVGLVIWILGGILGSLKASR